MKTFLAILALVFCISAGLAKHKYKTEYFRHDSRFYDSINNHKVAWFIGSLFSIASEAFCWWYAVEHLFMR